MEDGHGTATGEALERAVNSVRGALPSPVGLMNLLKILAIAGAVTVASIAVIKIVELRQ